MAINDRKMFQFSPKNTCSKAQEPFTLLDLGYNANHMRCKSLFKAFLSSEIKFFDTKNSNVNSITLVSAIEFMKSISS